jgi:DNA-directed RNA polymerase subunit alpha|tara:strand:+ start:1461 stop:2261 length:801 start_codon:yes stop_codon:yes gene_type:complete
MSKLICLETYLKEDQTHYGCFLIEPLEIGQGITLGNALRRTLLSDLTGFAITGVRINNLKHEFATVEGLREDVLEIILNLKEITFRSSFAGQEKKPKWKAFLNVKGPTVVTAGMFNLPKNSNLKILNPSQYICTIGDESEFYLEVDIENGKGYRLTDENRRLNLGEKFSPIRPSTLLIDSVFMPIKKVNYKTKLIHDTQGNIKESLTFEITTNGSLTAKRSLQEAVKILMNLFYPLFVTPNFLTVSSSLAKNFYQAENVKDQSQNN